MRNKTQPENAACQLPHYPGGLPASRESSQEYFMSGGLFFSYEDCRGELIVDDLWLFTYVSLMHWILPTGSQFVE